MAKYYDGYMGAFSGKLGTAIGYMWKGRPCLRSWQANPKNRRTRAQQQGRRIFGIASALSANMSEATHIGLRGLAETSQMSEGNIFIRLNRHCINVENETVNIDYSALKVSDGDLPGVSFGKVHSSEQHEIRVDYDQAEGVNGAYTDYVYLYAYVPSLACGKLSMPSARSAHRVSLSTPTCWAGREVHLYGFVWDHERKTSTSSYIDSFYIE